MMSSMVTSNNSTDGFQKTNRPILGDLTNQLGKRAWQLDSGNSVGQTCDGIGKNVNEKGCDFNFTQKVCLGVENIVKEKSRTNCVINENEKGKRVCISPRPCSEINSLKGNIISGMSKIPSEAKESISLGSILRAGESNLVFDNVLEIGDVSRDSCISSIAIPIVSLSCGGDFCDNDEGRVTSEVAKSDLVGEQLGTQASQSDSHDIDVDNLVTGKYESAEFSRLPKPQGLKSFELGRCIGLKGDGSSNSSTGVELIKACSCSFCTKAAYIWSDLHYQDMKGRIAALKKSQKEAGILVHRSLRDKVTNKHDQGICNTSSKIESDLMGQWRSLFLHTEDIFARETNQLEASLYTLKELRETCKMDLETINGVPSEKH